MVETDVHRAYEPERRRMRTWSLTPTTQMHKPTLHMDLDENMKISKLLIQIAITEPE